MSSDPIAVIIRFDAQIMELMPIVVGRETRQLLFCLGLEFKRCFCSVFPRRLAACDQSLLEPRPDGFTSVKAQETGSGVAREQPIRPR